ncbi:DUF397 domain-containing protein [Nocardia sp. NPDC046763]|uniref:DUF397 domain-containing protein n=1 Tax=Nocardia sp. NPDC046763 TaxID=3155256 RepID=UPI0033ED7082
MEHPRDRPCPVQRSLARNSGRTDTRVRNALFRKSSKSGNGPDCVEVAFLADGDVAVRHSKAPQASGMANSSGRDRRVNSGRSRGQRRARWP